MHTIPRQQIEEAFTPGEPKQVLSQLKAGKAAGQDGIGTDLLKRLSNKGSSVLLTILNSSSLLNCCPQIRCSENVVPFLINGKNPADVGSYRQIALTWTKGKVLERLIANHMLCWLEEQRFLAPGKWVFARDVCRMVLVHAEGGGFWGSHARRVRLFLSQLRIFYRWCLLHALFCASCSFAPGGGHFKDDPSSSALSLTTLILLFGQAVLLSLHTPNEFIHERFSPFWLHA